ncbi:MAG: hypothetical protein QM758_11290 [Armatimonas sp.]
MGFLTAYCQCGGCQGSGHLVELAESWADLLRKAVKLPGLTVSETGLVVPLKEGRTIKLGGVARGPIVVRSERSDKSPVNVAPDPRTGQILISGDTLGRDVLYVEREGAQIKVDVNVMDYAIRIEHPQPVVVTGEGVSTDKLGRLAMNSLQAAIQPAPGATVKYDAVEQAPIRRARPRRWWFPLPLPDRICYL